MRISSKNLVTRQGRALTPRGFSCNWLGGHASVLAMDWFGNETLHQTPFRNMTIRGSPVAAIQNVDNFSFAYVI
jgi:hypothetical protein